MSSPSSQRDDTPGGLGDVGGSSNADDLVLPFRAISSGINGRLVRVGPLVDSVLRRHDYPLPVCRILGEALVLAAMLGTALKSGSRFTLQTKTDGPIDFLVVDFQAPGQLRGYANFNRDAVERVEVETAGLSNAERDGLLLGTGRLAMTVDPGPGLNQYQGLVSVDGGDLSAIALNYFRQSEQLPTFIRLAVAQAYTATASDWSWRAGGLMVQHTATAGGTPEAKSAPEADAADDPDAELPMRGEHDEDWSRTRILAETVEDHELLDPLLRPEELLYRLFHEEGVTVFETRPLIDHCSCTRERIALMLEGFAGDDIADMRTDDGQIEVACQFCSRTYLFDPDRVTTGSGEE